MTRHDPIAEPRPAHPRPRPRRPALHGRQIATAAPDHIDDDARQFCAIETPAVVRAAATMTEAYRQLVDAQGRDAVSLDPAHGCAQADAIRDARRRRAKQVAAQVVRDLDGHGEPRIVASLVLEALERDGVL